MKNPKRNEMVVMGCCGKSHKSYGITVRQDKRNCVFQWAFKINPTAAKREGFDKNKLKGHVIHDDAFPGCPYCGDTNWWQCGNCGCIVCMDENSQETYVKCPRCGNEGHLEAAEEFTFNGGAM